jgi:hypothetical protein
MKLLLSLLLLLGTAFTVYADYPAESYGADPSLPSNSLAIQSALDDAGSHAGGVVTITKPGTYLLQTLGANPYRVGHKYCLEMRHNNITLSLGQGVTLKLANGQQTTEPVDIVVFQSKSNLVFQGASQGSSVITGNTAGQSWGGGYAQIENGIIISGYGTPSTFNSNITIKNLTLKDHFSNSINIDVSGGSSARNQGIRIRDVTSSDCGEGIQVIHADDVWITDCTSESPNHVAVGDAIEVSDVTRYYITNNTVRNHWGGSGFDIYGSNFGVVDGFIVEDCVNGVNVHGGFTVPNPEQVLVKNGLIYNPPAALNNDGVELLGTSLKNITFSNIKIRGNPLTIGFQGPGDGTTLKAHGPVSIIDCEVTGASDGIMLQPISELTIRGGRYSNNVGRGIVLLYVANLTDQDVASLRIDGVEASDNGSFGILISSQGFNVPKLTGSITNCVLNNGAGPLSVGPESEKLYLRNNIPQKQPPWVFWVDH